MFSITIMIFTFNPFFGILIEEKQEQFSSITVNADSFYTEFRIAEERCENKYKHLKNIPDVFERLEIIDEVKPPIQFNYKIKRL